MEPTPLNELETLEKRRQKLEKEIAETRKRLPAHSTKPPIIIELLALEDEYDDVLKKIKKLKS